MNLSFETMPLYLDIVSFVFLGTLIAVMFAFIPMVVCGSMVCHEDDKMFKWDFWVWSIITVLAFVGGYVFAYAILADWVD